MLSSTNAVIVLIIGYAVGQASAHFGQLPSEALMSTWKVLVVGSAAAVAGAWLGLPPSGSAASRNPEVLQLSGDIEGVHDPVLIRQDDTYYVFCTGGRAGVGAIPIRTSKNLRHWTLSGYVFVEASRVGNQRNSPGERSLGAGYLIFQW